MNVHEIFPIAIGQDLIEEHEEFKLNYLDDARSVQERHKENNWDGRQTPWSLRSGRQKP